MKFIGHAVIAFDYLQTILQSVQLSVTFTTILKSNYVLNQLVQRKQKYTQKRNIIMMYSVVCSKMSLSNGIENIMTVSINSFYYALFFTMV